MNYKRVRCSFCGGVANVISERNGLFWETCFDCYDLLFSNWEEHEKPYPEDICEVGEYEGVEFNNEVW